MTLEFIAAVVDTLLPGDEVLPSGHAAGLPLADYGEPHRPVLDAIAAQSGGIESFIRADDAVRATATRAVERSAPEPFRALLTAVLFDYYESELVLAALSWRTDPPQPTGHVVTSMDDATATCLDRVSQRVPLWRALSES